MSWRDIIKVHPACELIPEMTADERKALGEDIKAKGGQPDFPVVLWRDEDGKVWLLDGRSRLDAMEERGLKIFSQDKPTGNLWDMIFPLYKTIDYHHNPDFDPYAFVLSANVHRRHLNAEQRRESIAAILKATPEKTDRQIAKETGASPSTVHRARRKSNASKTHKEERREGSGRRARGRRPGQSKAALLRESREKRSGPTAPAASTAPTTPPLPPPSVTPDIAVLPEPTPGETATEPAAAAQEPAEQSAEERGATKIQRAHIGATKIQDAGQVTLGPRFGAADGTTAAEMDRRRGNTPLERLSPLSAAAQTGNDVDPEQSAAAHRAAHAASESAPAPAPEPTKEERKAAETAELDRIAMNYARGAKDYAVLFKPPVIKDEHIAAAREAAKAWEAVAEALSERMTAGAESKICAQCKDTIKPPELVIAPDGQPVHKWCEKFWNRDKGGVHHGKDAAEGVTGSEKAAGDFPDLPESLRRPVPPTVPPEPASNPLQSRGCAVVPGGEP